MTYTSITLVNITDWLLCYTQFVFPVYVGLWQVYWFLHVRRYSTIFSIVTWRNTNSALATLLLLSYICEKYFVCTIITAVSLTNWWLMAISHTWNGPHTQLYLWAFLLYLLYHSHFNFDGSMPTSYWDLCWENKHIKALLDTYQGPYETSSVTGQGWCQFFMLWFS